MQASETYPWLPAWVSHNRLLLLVQSGIGYTRKGRGIILVTLGWDMRGEASGFQMNTRYLSAADIEIQIPSPDRIEVLNLLETYTPENQAVLLFAKPSGRIVHSATLLRGEGLISNIANSLEIQP